MRRNTLDGTGQGPEGPVVAGNSIVARLTTLLGYLSNRYPAEGWSSFVSEGSPSWGRIVLGGHSQGGGDAATVFPLDGVIMLSSPEDSTPLLVAAAWLSAPSMVPLTRYVGFAHTSDPFYPRARAAWTALGLDRLGASSVDGGTPPYGGAHELITSTVPLAAPLATHDITAVDQPTPKCPDGVPAFAPVWRYMLDVAAGLPVDPSDMGGCSGSPAT